MIAAAKSDAFMALAATKGFTVAPLGHAEFETLLAAENELVKGIMQEAGLYKSKKAN
jgi:hypothetical protein